MKLHNFFNSSSSYRVRILLALKGIPYDYVPVNIRLMEHRDATYVSEINPSAVVPALELEGGGEFKSLGQSMAIMDYLDRQFPEPRLIPDEPGLRARVLELANLVASDIHPLNNPRVLRRLESQFGADQSEKTAWYQYWISEGLAGVERLLERYGLGPYCFGETPTLADVCLIPQIANAMRWGASMGAYPKAMAVYNHAILQPAFIAAEPGRQPDFVA